MSDLERRDLFKIIAAGTLAAPADAQTHVHAPVAKAARKPFFNASETAVLDRLSDIIIPTDEQSPGAHDAGAVHFLDVLAGVSDAGRQTRWRSGVATVEAAARARFSKAFMECSRDQQEQIVAAMAAHEGAPENDLERFFEFLKPAVVDGYRYSEVGVKQFMRWVGNHDNTDSWHGACSHEEHKKV